MTFAFNDHLRRRLEEMCAAFPRRGSDGGDGALKRAAVAITLLETLDGSGEAGFLLTRRADKLRAHGGQWALPGGRCDRGETVAQAALRELDEEIGLKLDAQAVLGLLDDYPTRSGYLVTPAVVWAGLRPGINVNLEEVASVHRIALADIVRTDAVDFISIPQSPRRVVRIHINGSRVHAPTAAFLYQFREMLAGRTTRVADLEQPVFAWR